MFPGPRRDRRMERVRRAQGARHYLLRRVHTALHQPGPEAAPRCSPEGRGSSRRPGSRIRRTRRICGSSCTPGAPGAGTQVCHRKSHSSSLNSRRQSHPARSQHSRRGSGQSKADPAAIPPRQGLRQGQHWPFLILLHRYHPCRRHHHHQINTPGRAQRQIRPQRDHRTHSRPAIPQLVRVEEPRRPAHHPVAHLDQLAADRR